MHMNGKARSVAILIAVGLLGLASVPAEAAVNIEGQVQAGGGALAGSAVTLFAASANSPARLAEAKTDAEGRFVISAEDAPAGSILYLVAKGGEPTVNKGKALFLV